MSRSKTKDKIKFTTQQASLELIEAMEDAIRNMTAEVRKKPDQEAVGSARKAELQAIKDTAMACSEMIRERQRLVQLVQDLDEGDGTMKEEQDYSGGFAERYSKK